MTGSKAYFLFIPIMAVSFSPSCKSKNPQITPQATYDVNPPEMLKDPNPLPSVGTADESPLNLNTTNTPCVSQISTYGTVADRAWRDAFSRAVMQRICGKDPATAKPWRTATAYNPNSWVAGINLTAVTQNVPRGTAITPRHVIYTKHYGFHGQVGQTLNFLTMDNRVVSRKIIDVKFLSSTFDPDIAVARLDSDLPGSITPMKVLHPNATNYAAIFSPLLRIDQESKALIVQATPSGPQGIQTDASVNPPGAAYSLYYEDMISGDSSSPSILLMNTNNGVMPILFSVVTYSGPGQGPKMGANFSQIQSAIESFGDAHKIVTAPEPAAPKAAPSCSVTASRVGSTNNCAITIVGSADDVTGNPVVTPATPSSWSRSGNTWTGQSPCSLNSETTFTATLTGLGGKGRSCESGVITPVVVLPTCTVSAKRKDQGDTCDLTVNQTAGRTADTLNVSPSSALPLTRSGTTWSGSGSCPKNSTTTFSATLTNSDGKGPSCVSETILPLLSPPSCAISAARSGNSDSCTYTLTRTSGAGTVSSFSIAGSSVNWNGNTPASNTIKCSQTNDALFVATVIGPNGTASCTTTVAKLPPPACTLSASRQGSAASCSITLTGSGIIESTKQPVVAPAAVGSWSANSWAGTASCATNITTNFTATIEGPGGSKASCTSNSVTAVPTTPTRSCRANAVRRGTTGNCTLTLTITGQMTGNPRVTPYAPPSWTRSGDQWIGNASCPLNRDTIYSVNLTGPSGGWGCGSNKVTAIRK